MRNQYKVHHRNKHKVHSRMKYNNPDNKQLRPMVNRINTAENPATSIMGTIILRWTKNKTTRGNRAPQCNRNKALRGKHKKHRQTVNLINTAESPVMRITDTITRH